LAFVAYGVRIGVRVTDAAVLDRLTSRFPPGWRPLRSPIVDLLFSLVVGGEGPRPGVRRFHVAYSGPARIARTPRFETAVDALEASIHTHVGLRARHRTFVHAGVVGWRGRAIVISGTPFSGKSRLVATLVRAGARYYSDEFAVLDALGRVHPYATALMVRGPGGQPRHPIESLGGRIGRRPLPVGLVLATRYVPGRRWRPRSLTRGQAVLELLNGTLRGRRAPDAILDVLSRAVERASAVKGARGEADDMAREILDVDRWPRPEPMPADPAPTVTPASVAGG